MARPVRPIALALLVLTGLVTAAYLPERLPGAHAQSAILAQNDAGSGQDAGNTPPDALLTASATRTYAGNLSPAGTDVDWFRHDRGDAFCAEAEATLTTAGQVTLAGSVLLDQSVSQGALPHAPVKVALAAPGGGAPLLGIEPAPTLMSGTSGPTSPGRYTFRFHSQGLLDLDPEGDGESPEAGPTAATSVPLPATCFAGRLAGASDTVDRYHFDVASAREITLSLAIAGGEGDARLTLVSPSGAAVATMGSGGLANVYASETGRWSLVVERPAAQPAAASLRLPLLAATGPGATTELALDYLVAMSDGPGSDPCRPSC